ncbi:hypothetical protein L6259_00155 [Candidatus Parcubacteria bacterium]|nr:hypothetical protein [Candidatus Parcubacteria bacterium]
MTATNLKKEKTYFGVVLCAIFFGLIYSFAFANPSFEVAPQSAPTVSGTTVAPATQNAGSNIIITSQIVDVSGVKSAKIEVKNSSNAIVATVNLYDDGVHNDGLAKDGVYGVEWKIPVGFSAGTYKVFVVASDIFEYVFNAQQETFDVTILACVPSKTCADYPGQCGINLSNGCANVLDCSGSCVVPKICCSGTCALPTCSNNSDCDDSDNCTTDSCNNGGTCSASCSNPSIVTCATGPNCRAAALANASVTADVCCPGESCYQCNTGFSWDGTACVAGCTPTCATGPACRTASLVNASATADICCGAGEFCYKCDTGFIWDGAACVTCAENWYCYPWTLCAGGIQTRNCLDLNNCGTTADKPGLSRSCVVPPSSFDWRNVAGVNWMTPVKNQGSCGSCTAFSTLGAVEAVYNIEINDSSMDIDLSEQDFISCSGTVSCTGLGGSPWSTYKYINSTGIVPESCFPYLASNAVCARCVGWASSLWKTNTFTYGSSPSQQAIKDAIRNGGPVTVGLNMDPLSGGWDSGTLGCVNDTALNHGVVIVGYDDAGGYWIVRNSYGPGWPDGIEGGGYFRVLYGECGIETIFVSPEGITSP